MDTWVPVLIAVLALPGAIIGAMAAARKVANDRAAAQDDAMNKRYDQLQEDFKEYKAAAASDLKSHKEAAAAEIAGLRAELRQERAERRVDNDAMLRQGLVKDDYIVVLRHWGATNTDPPPRTPPPFPSALTA